MILRLLCAMATIMTFVGSAAPTQGEEKMSDSRDKRPSVKIELIPNQKGIDYRVDHTYIAKLGQKIQNKWQELGIRRSIDPGVKVKFLVHLGGELSNLRVQSSSGNHDIDQNALKSVRFCAPFEKPLHADDTKTPPTELWFQATF